MVYVVERYLPGLSRSDLLRGLSELERAMEDRARAGGALPRLDHRARDEACFCRFEGPSEAAVAEANRKAGLPFDRIVPAVTVTPRREKSMNVMSNMPATVQIRRTRLLGLVATVAAVTVAVTWAIASIVDAGTHTVRTTVPTTASVLSSLSPSERQHVQAITSMTPAELKATFGTGNVDAIERSGSRPRREVRPGDHGDDALRARRPSAPASRRDRRSWVSPEDGEYVESVSR